MSENMRVKTTECAVGEMVYTIYAGLSQTYDANNCAFFHVTKYKVVAPEWSLCAREEISKGVSNFEKPVVIEEVYRSKKDALLACSNKLQKFIDNISKTINQALEQAMLIIDKE